MHLSILFSLFIVPYTAPALVTWAPNRSFNIKSNFKDNIAPCSRRIVVFPESVQESIQIDASVAVSGLILPVDGQILLSEGESLLFGAVDDRNCTSDGFAFYTDNSSSTWDTPGVWISSKFNKATPDAERIPCYDDTVLFPTESQFSIQLPDVTQHVAAVTIGGINRTTEDFSRYLSEESTGFQQFVMGPKLNNHPLLVDQRLCQSTVGCPCQIVSMKIKCDLKYCTQPKCTNPIKPVGHCCEICGGSLLFEVDNFNFVAFKNLVKSTIDKYGAEQFVYHIGVLPTVDGWTMKKVPKRVQVVVMDKDEYNGASSEVINEIGYQLSNQWVKHEKLVLLSGSPVSESGLGGKIVISMFFAVVGTMGGMFAYYYRTSGINLSELRNGLSAPRGMLSRFQGRSDSVVSLTRRDSSVSALREAGTSFRNPLYDSKRGRVQVTESTLEE